MQYLVIVEQSATGYGAYVPDLPGCVAVAETHDDVLKLIHEAIAFHIEGLREEGRRCPLPFHAVHTWSSRQRRGCPRLHTPWLSELLRRRRSVR